VDIFLSVVITINAIFLIFTFSRFRVLASYINQLIEANNNLSTFISEQLSKKGEASERIQEAEAAKLDAEADVLKAQAAAMTKENKMGL